MTNRHRRERDRQSRGSLRGNQQRPEPSVSGGTRHPSESSSAGKGGGVLPPRGAGLSPGVDSRAGASASESRRLAAEGIAAGAAGFRSYTGTGRFKPGATGAEEEDEGMDGGAAVTGVSGVSGGGRGTTSSNNTRR